MILNCLECPMCYENLKKDIVECRKESRQLPLNKNKKYDGIIPSWCPMLGKTILWPARGEYPTVMYHCGKVLTEGRDNKQG